LTHINLVQSLLRKVLNIIVSSSSQEKTFYAPCILIVLQPVQNKNYPFKGIMMGQKHRWPWMRISFYNNEKRSLRWKMLVKNINDKIS
jgi:hypothetical protein